MTIKTKGRNGLEFRATPKAVDSQHYTDFDIVIGCFNIAKPSRNRQKQRSWKHSNPRGRIDANLAAQVALLAVICILFVCGVTR